MPHKTWFLQAIRPQAKPAPGGRFSCPFCPRTAEYPAVVAHLQCHQRSMVEYEGYNIYKCHLTCLKEGHYHCDACQRAIVRKELFEKHLRKCSSSSSRTHQAVTPDVAVVSDPPSADTARTEAGISPDACSKRKNPQTACGWSSGETRYLISIWAEDPVQKKLEDSYRNRAVYESIAQKMNETGYKRTWQQCQRKIKQLKRLYRKVKNSSSKSDRADRTSFPFYDKLDQVLRDRPPFCPGEGGVLDSADSELSFCTETAEASESPITDEYSSTCIPQRGRNTSYLRRWFVLKGNLLFYQERPADRGLLGVIVLEGCVVQTGDSDVSFSLVFTGPGLRSYQLAADDQLSQKSWVNALLSASHVYISLLVRDLAHLYQEAKEGKSLGDSSHSSTSTDSCVKMSSSVIAAFYAGSPHLAQRSAPTHRDMRSYSASHAYPGHHTHHAPSEPIRSANKRSPKHWPKRNAHVTPLNGPAPKHGEWPLVGFDPMDEFVKLHEYYGNEVKQVRADWLKKKQQEAGHIEEDLIDLG